ncbi:MAG: hypothetical protein Q4P32_09475 [Micrococcales bacterium]|nr:hypothetical protein [Micrococcales bacterium]
MIERDFIGAACQSTYGVELHLAQVAHLAGDAVPPLRRVLE